jgi:hypothetical protein
MLSLGLPVVRLGRHISSSIANFIASMSCSDVAGDQEDAYLAAFVVALAGPTAADPISSRRCGHAQDDPSYEQGLTPGSVLRALTNCSPHDGETSTSRQIINADFTWPERTRDGITEIDGSVYAAPLDVGEHSFERRQVTVYVGDDGDPHWITCRWFYCEWPLVVPSSVPDPSAPILSSLPVSSSARLADLWPAPPTAGGTAYPQPNLRL